MPRVCLLIAIVLLALAAPSARPQAPEAAATLVREVVYNEMQDHSRHGLWRYWVEQHRQGGTRLEVQVETSDGPVDRLMQTNGSPIDAQVSHAEQERLESLVTSPGRRTLQREEYWEDEKHIALVLDMLAGAYLFDDSGDDHGYRHLRFRPNPGYVSRTIDGRVLHSMEGELWIDPRAKRMARLDGHLMQNVDFGFGLLGRLDKGGWFRMQRVQVSPTEWKTNQLEVHLSGRAMLFKTISHETSEVRGGFAPVPPGTSLNEGVRLLEQNHALVLPLPAPRGPAASVITR